MKKLVIAEKPHLGRSIALGIREKFQKGDGFLESENYIVTWGFGHLFGLIDIEEYRQDYDAGKRYPWQLENLPFFPEEFRFGLLKTFDAGKKRRQTDEGVKHQFLTICDLLKRKDVECVIHAGDADREGEVIVRLILDNAGYQGNVMRLWEDDQSPATLGRGIRERLQPDRNFDNFAREGYARTYIDWLYGINLTRYVSVKAGKMLRLGRVINAIVKAIYDRDMAIKDFCPEKYYVIAGRTALGEEELKVTYPGRYSSMDDARQTFQEVQGKQGRVQDVRKEQKEIRPGKLFSITKLQGVMGKRYKMTPDVTLANLQKLYEKGYVTYPRTSSEYLAEGDKEDVIQVISILQGMDYDVVMKEKKTVFDSTKVESHGAIRLTKNIPDADALPQGEKLVYQTVFQRFLAVFCRESCLMAQTIIVISIGNASFEVQGTSLLQKGWQKYEESTKKDKLLPEVRKGQMLSMEYEIAEKKTSPPKHYTTESLNAFMDRPFQKESGTETIEDSEEQDSDEEEYRAMLNGMQIGTGATRGPIIKNAIDSGYITLENDTYRIAENGIYMIETLEKLGIHLDKGKTAQFGINLKKVSRGEMSVEECVSLCQRDVEECMAGRDIIIEQRTDKISLGKCPACGKEVYENPKSFSCSGYRETGCSFAVWKNDKLLAAFHKKMTPEMMKKLLNDGSIQIRSGKKGRKVSVKTLRYIKKENGYWGWDFLS